MFRRKLSGITVVELLVVAAILGILFAIITSYFVQQTQLTKRTQARQEAEIKARTVAELVVQDLQVAGSGVVFIDSSNDNVDNPVKNTVQIECSAGSANKCISSSSSSGAQDALKLRYATSLRSYTAGESCRDVEYTFSTNTLQRSDVVCKSAVSRADIADNITRLNIEYFCGDDGPADPPEDDPNQCYVGGTFPRQARVTVEAQSEALADVIAEVTLSTSMPNLRY